MTGNETGHVTGKETGHVTGKETGHVTGECSADVGVAPFLWLFDGRSSGVCVCV